MLVRKSSRSLNERQEEELLALLARFRELTELIEGAEQQADRHAETELAKLIKSKVDHFNQLVCIREQYEAVKSLDLGHVFQEEEDQLFDVDCESPFRYTSKPRKKNSNKTSPSVQKLTPVEDVPPFDLKLFKTTILECEAGVITADVLTQLFREFQAQSLAKQSPDLALQSLYQQKGHFPEEFIQQLKKLPEPNFGKLRGAIWNIIIGNALKIESQTEQKCKSALDFYKGVGTLEESFGTILKDLSRTFPKIKGMEKTGPFSRRLQSLLEGFVVYAPHIGYVQGMTYPASLLILMVPQQSTFATLCNFMLCNTSVRDLYSFKQEYLSALTVRFWKGLKKTCPRLFGVFKAEEISPELFLIEWLFSLYCRAFKLQVVMSGPYQSALGPAPAQLRRTPHHHRSGHLQAHRAPAPGRGGAEHHSAAAQDDRPDPVPGAGPGHRRHPQAHLAQQSGRTHLTSTTIYLMLSEFTIPDQHSAKGLESQILAEINLLRSQPERPLEKLIAFLDRLRSESLRLAGIEIKELGPEQSQVLANYLRELMRNKVLLSELSEVKASSVKPVRSYSYFLQEVNMDSLEQVLLACVLQEFRHMRTKTGSSAIRIESEEFVAEELVLLSNNFSHISIQAQDLGNGQFSLKLHFFSNDKLYKSRSSLLPHEFAQVTQLKQNLTEGRRVLTVESPVPFAVVAEMVRKMDLDFDQRISAEDINRQFERHQFARPANLHNEMFLDARSIRNKSSELKKQLSDEQVYIAMRSYRKKVKGEWVLVEKKYRAYWMKLLQFVTGFSCTIVKRVQEPLEEVSRSVKKITGLAVVREEKEPMIRPRNWPEGGVVVNNTRKIHELYTGEGMEHREENDHPFSKIVNSKVEEANLKTFTFLSKQYYREAERLSRTQPASEAAKEINVFSPSVFNIGEYQQSLQKIHKNETNFLLAESSLEQHDIQWLQDAIDQKSLVFNQQLPLNKEKVQPQRVIRKVKPGMVFTRPESNNSLKARLAQFKWQKHDPDIGFIEGIPVVVYPRNEEMSYKQGADLNFRDYEPVKDKPPFITAHKIPPLAPLKYQSLNHRPTQTSESLAKTNWINYFKIPDNKHSLTGLRFQNMGKVNFCNKDGKVAHFETRIGNEWLYFCNRCAKAEMEQGVMLRRLKGTEQEDLLGGLINICRTEQGKNLKLVFKPLGKNDRCNLGQI